MRILAAPVAFLLLATFAPMGLFTEPVPVRAAAISFSPIPLDDDAPDRRSVGPLTYVRGWHLRSDNPRFGGISAIHVGGGQVIALSDAGSLIRFELPGRSRNSFGSIDILPEAPGSPDIKSQRDVESLAVHEDHAWLGFERQNAIWRYRLSDWRSDADYAPRLMRRWPSNMGPEGLVRLADGRFLVFAEGARGEGSATSGTTPVLLFAGDPALAATRVESLTYAAPPGYRVTDAALLPDGRILILCRRFALLEGISAKLLVAAVPKRGESLLRGAEVADLRSPLNIDNMEGLGVEARGGRTFVWLASDDNFNPLQRTLLLQFELKDLAPKP